MNKPNEILSKHFWHNFKEIHLDQKEALQALHAATIAALPKKYEHVDLDHPAVVETNAWNSCVDQIKAAINSLYGINDEK